MRDTETITTVSQMEALFESNSPWKIEAELETDQEFLYLGYATNSVTNSGSGGMYVVSENEYDCLEMAQELLYNRDIENDEMKFYEEDAKEFEMDAYEFWCDTVSLCFYRITKEVFQFIKTKAESLND